MDELVTLEEADGGSDILLVVPKATVLQVRQSNRAAPRQRSGRGRGGGGLHGKGLLLTLPSPGLWPQLSTSPGLTQSCH